MIRCSICPKEADYPDAVRGPICKNCWLALKLFENRPKLVARAKRYLRFKGKSRKSAVDVKFAALTSEPVVIPEVVKSQLVQEERKRAVKVSKQQNRQEWFNDPKLKFQRRSAP